MFKIKHHYASTYLVLLSCTVTAATAHPGIITYIVLFFNMLFLFGTIRWARHEGRTEEKIKISSSHL